MDHLQNLVKVDICFVTGWHFLRNYENVLINKTRTFNFVILTIQNSKLAFPVAMRKICYSHDYSSI